MPNPCCCLRLRTAGLLIGILEIVSWSINLTVAGVFLLLTAYVDKAVNTVNQKFESGYHLDISNGTWATVSVNDYDNTNSGFDSMDNRETEDLYRKITISYIVTSLSMLLSVVRIFIAGILLLGIQKNNISLVKSWFVVKIAVLGLTICLFITSFATGNFQARSITYYVLSLGGGFYFLWVIFEMMAEMKTTAINARHPKNKI